MSDIDTIVAIATAPGQGGVGIVRVSGPLAVGIAEGMLHKVPAPRYAQYGDFLDEQAQTMDTGIALYFPAPHSFTGEDVLELHAHGGPMVLDMIVQRAIALGARAARAGEFSERAFLNDKIDLAQAEAIADLIAADSRDAARAAMHSLAGEFSATIHALVDKLIQLRIHVEAALDFPEEEIDFLADDAIANQLADVRKELNKVMAAAGQGRLLKEGMKVVIAGKPNAGKSSLLNRLAGQDTAIVTDIPGTTRDVLREHIQIDGLPLHIIDTAGLRDSDDAVEQEGIRRAMHEIEHADRLLYVIEGDADVGRAELNKWKPENKGVTLVHNKIDLINDKARLEQHNEQTEVYVSAKTGDGIELLRDHLKQCMGYEQGTEGICIARRRHLEALEKANDYLKSAHDNLHETMAGELLAEELLAAQNTLASITGEFSSDDLLGRIFSDFCIGK